MKMSEFVAVALLALLFAGLAPVPVEAQTGRTVDLTWNDTRNPLNTQYNVYRADVACTAPSPVFVKLNTTPLAVKTFSNTGVAPGTYCYRVTAVLGGLPESAPSNTAEAGVGLASPTGLTITIQVALTWDRDGNLSIRAANVDPPRFETGRLVTVPVRP